MNSGSVKDQAELNDEHRSGRPTSATTRLLFQRADELIPNNRRITTRQLATVLSVSKGSVSNMTHALGYSKMCARWVPRSLTDYHETVPKVVCSDLLPCYEAGGESFLSRIVTENET